MVKADNVSPIPKKLSVEQAGVMASDALTALRGLDEILELKRGELLMVFGAGGGIGHLAVQLAKRMGARVFAVASGDDGVALARRLEKLNRLIESGPFEVHVARTFPLDKAADAHRELDKHYLGKLALRPQ